MTIDTWDPNYVITVFYQVLLRREPDAAGLALYAGQLRDGRTLAEILHVFLTSNEYRKLSDRPLEPSFHLDLAPPMAVQTNYSADERQAVWDHIAQVWSAYGKAEPFWSVVTHEHWRSRNMVDEDRVEAFYSTGENDVRRLDAWLTRNGLILNPKATCAEYGCGVGRITHALARRFQHIAAFDISQPHLELAQQHLARMGVTNIEYVLVRGETDLSRMSGVDFFFSVIVLQHNPPPISTDILTRAFNGLNSGGVAFFQIPTYGFDYKFSIDEYWDKLAREETMEMHAFPQRLILEIGRQHGVFPIEIQPDGAVGQSDRWISNTFLMQKIPKE